MDSDFKLTDLDPKLKVVAVSKTRSCEEVLQCMQKTGICEFAENRLDEAMQKIPQLPTDLKWHFIGKLQSRKIRKIVELFDVIQSVESLDQAEKISACGVPIEVFLQVNVSGKEQRSGCSVSEAPALIQAMQKLPNLTLSGVMGMASPLSEVGEAVVRREFETLKSLQGSLEHCSMGMSGDWSLAIESGSTMLRLGRILFQQ